MLKLHRSNCNVFNFTCLMRGIYMFQYLHCGASTSTGLKKGFPIQCSSTAAGGGQTDHSSYTPDSHCLNHQVKMSEFMNIHCQ